MPEAWPLVALACGGWGTGVLPGSMEARKGPSDPKRGKEPGPGAYYEGVEGDPTTSRSRLRKVVPPSSFFRSKVPKAMSLAKGYSRWR